MQLTDTHCHLYFNDYEKDKYAVLARAWAAGLQHILAPGIDLTTSQAALDLAEVDARLFASVGIHPNSSSTWDGQSLEAMEMMAGHAKVIAIGEIGLDYYRDRAPRDHQKQVFREQLALAERLNLPVVIHTRDASLADRSCMADTLQILAEFKLTGVLHSFSGNLADANHTIGLGFFLGISGPVTFRQAAELREVVASVPLDYILIETDGPFLTPHPHRGKRNEPAYVRFIAEQISEIREQPLQIVAEATSENAKRLFGWR